VELAPLTSTVVPEAAVAALALPVSSWKFWKIQETSWKIQETDNRQAMKTDRYQTDSRQ